MGLVSTSKYQKARLRLAANDHHYSSFSDIVDEILKSVVPNEYETRIFLKSPNPGKRKLFLIFNSVKGLCAGYNTQIGNVAQGLIGKELLDFAKNHHARLTFQGPEGSRSYEKASPPSIWKI